MGVTLGQQVEQGIGVVGQVARPRLVYPASTLTSPVSPVKGPSVGGNTIGIDGTNFTATSVVKVGGVAATGVKVASVASTRFRATRRGTSTPT